MLDKDRANVKKYLLFFFGNKVVLNYEEGGLESLRPHRPCLFFTPLAVKHNLHHTGYYPSFYQSQLILIFMMLMVLVSMFKCGC